jgi:hypothetical protein
MGVKLFTPLRRPKLAHARTDYSHFVPEASTLTQVLRTTHTRSILALGAEWSALTRSRHEFCQLFIPIHNTLAHALLGKLLDAAFFILFVPSEWCELKPLE